MKRTNMFTRRLLMLTGYVFIIISTRACQVLSGGVQVQDGTLQLDDGLIVVKNDDGDWAPVAGESTFELVGTLESMDPWMVAGFTLRTNDATQIAEGLQVDDIVRVRGCPKRSFSLGFWGR